MRFSGLNMLRRCFKRAAFAACAQAYYGYAERCLFRSSLPEKMPMWEIYFAVCAAPATFRVDGPRIIAVALGVGLAIATISGDLELYLVQRVAWQFRPFWLKRPIFAL